MKAITHAPQEAIPSYMISGKRYDVVMVCREPSKRNGFFFHFLLNDEILTSAEKRCAHLNNHNFELLRETKLDYHILYNSPEAI